MPIVVKDFTWKQMPDKICIQVPLHGLPPNKVDIFTSPQYIKATFGAFFFETLLLHPVDISQSHCTKTDSYIVFDLIKCSEEVWDSLEFVNISKEDKAMLKKKLIEEEHERIQKGFDEKRSKKAELKRVAINAQIQLDTKTRKQIEEIKKDEESKALGDLNEWKTNVETCRGAKSKIVELEDDADENEMLNSRQKNVGSTKRTTKAPKSTRSKEAPRAVATPKPRSIRSLQILFTPREFPTPSRESRLEEENEFLSKQAEARRSVGFVDEDLRPEEKNPHYLLGKGREFLKNTNYLGAISAFSFGIKLSPKFVDLYLARSEAHLLIGNFNRAVEDCTKALNLYKPPLPINLQERTICLGRRGIALFKLGFFKQGISELEASVKLNNTPEFANILEECRLEFEEIQSKQNNEFDQGNDKLEK